MARQTSKAVASKASKVLLDPNSSAAEKSAAGSALTPQYKAAKEETSAKAASKASEVLRDPTSTAAEKSAAASTLSQRADK